MDTDELCNSGVWVYMYKINIELKGMTTRAQSTCSKISVLTRKKKNTNKYISHGTSYGYAFQL